MRRAATFLLICLGASTASADEDVEGTRCNVSAECGELRCIDGFCRNPLAQPKEGDLSLATSGFKAMFGNGQEYQTAVVVGDIAASISVPILIFLDAVTNNAIFGVLSVFPTTLTGPIIHAANGRWAPAVISFFGWASVPPSAVGLGVLVEASGPFNDASATAGIATFIGVASAGAIGMTVLDWWMARTVRLEHKPPSFSFAPKVAPIRGGVLAGVSGTW